MPILRLIAVLTLGIAACARSPEADDRDRVRHAIEGVGRVPSASIEDRRRAIEALARTPAATPAAVRARDTCAEAYRILLEGTELVRAAQAEAADAGLSPAIADRLGEAERKVDQSRERMADCDRAMVDLFPRR